MTTLKSPLCVDDFPIHSLLLNSGGTPLPHLILGEILTGKVSWPVRDGFLLLYMENQLFNLTIFLVKHNEPQSGNPREIRLFLAKTTGFCLSSNQNWCWPANFLLVQRTLILWCPTPPFFQVQPDVRSFGACVSEEPRKPRILSSLVHPWCSWEKLG